MIDDVHALLVLAERELLALAGIPERLGRDAGVLHEDRRSPGRRSSRRRVAGLELLDERNVHAADEADLLRVADERRERADEERALFLPELERRDVGRRRNEVARPCPSTARSRRRRSSSFGYSLASCVMSSVKMKPTPMTRSMPSAASSAQPGLAIGAFAGLDEPDRRAELALGALRAAIGAVVERLVAAPADVEHDADVDGVGGRRRRPTAAGRTNSSTTWAASERAHEDHQLSHAANAVADGTRGAARPMADSFHAA